MKKLLPYLGPSADLANRKHIARLVAERVVTDEGRTFRKEHPIVLGDGRRFASLKCAVHSATDAAGEPDLTVPIIDEFNGQLISYGDKKRAWVSLGLKEKAVA